MTLSLDNLRRRAKALKKAFAAGAPGDVARVHAILPQATGLAHADALHVVAHEEGYDSWPKLKAAAELAGLSRADRAERLKMALFHGHGDKARRLLDDDPTLGDENLGLQVALLRVDAVGDALALTPEAATQPVAGPRVPLLHLAFSHHWKVHPGGATASVRMAEILCAHGADPNAGFPAEPGSPHMLSALYGALCHAGNQPLGRWLLEHGADPNDNESLYHACELGHADGLRLLLDHGAAPARTNALPRAMDFDDHEMVTLLLEAGADPNEGVAGHPGTDIPATLVPGLHQAARRMCSPQIAEALIAHGADGRMRHRGHSAYATARIYGNHAVASVLERHGQATALDGTETLLAAAADGPIEGRIDPDHLTEETRTLLHRLLAQPGRLPHVKRLIGLGFDPNWTDEQGMPGLHVAAWEGIAEAVELLLAYGPDLTCKNAYGGDVMGTVIHGSEYCPARDARDHLQAAKLLLDAGARVHMHDVVHSGVAPMADMLRVWSEAHPERVVRDA